MEEAMNKFIELWKKEYFSDWKVYPDVSDIIHMKYCYSKGYTDGLKEGCTGNTNPFN